MAKLVAHDSPIPFGFEKVQISSQMGMLFSHLTEDQAEHILYGIKANMERYEENAKAFGREYNLKYIYDMSDKTLKQLNKTNPHKPSCKKGCAFCCKMEVMCSRIEAEYALKASEANDGLMTEDELETLRQQVKISEQGHLAFALSPHATCVFLTEDNECSVYEQRPMACRNYQVTNNPALCDAVTYPTEEVAIIAYVTTEAMRSVLINVEPYKLLPEHILDIYKEREDNGKEVPK